MSLFDSALDKIDVDETYGFFVQKITSSWPTQKRRRTNILIALHGQYMKRNNAGMCNLTAMNWKHKCILFDQFNLIETYSRGLIRH